MRAEWGQSGETSRGVHRVGRRFVRVRFNSSCTREKFLHGEAHLQTGQGSARTDVNPRSIQQIRRRIAVIRNAPASSKTRPSRLAEIQISEMRSPPPIFHRTGRDASVGHQRSVNPEDLVDRNVQQ